MTEQQTPSARSTSALGFTPGGAAWMALTVLVHIALASAAFETFRSGSSVRWWAVGGVVVYLAGLLATWRLAPGLWKRIGPAGLTAAGSGLLLGLLAVTAWLPGGSVNGIRLFGQSTSTVLSTATAVAVALSGFVLARVRLLPMWARYLAGGLAGYGVLSCVLGIARHISYPALLRGGGLWVHLPFWLQGAFLGAFLVVPAAMVFEALSIARAWHTPWTWRRLVALALSVIMAVPTQTVRSVVKEYPGSVALSNEELSRPLPSLEDTTRPVEDAQARLAAALQRGPGTRPAGEVADRLEKVVAELKTAVDHVPRDTFDPGAVVDMVGRDPAKLFEWVRNQTTLVPYRGVLRGPVGVLTDRYGNSLDRSLLLAELLRLAGHEARLARATLTETQARGVLRRTAAEPRPSPRAAPRPDQFLQNVSGAHARWSGGDAGEINQRFTELRAASEAIGRETMRRASIQSAALVQALGQSLKGPGAAAVQSRLADVADHWWVQQRVGNGWVDFDLAGTGARRGDALVAAATTLPPDQVGDDMQHRVRVRVSIERIVDGRLEENVVLDHTLRLTDVAGVRVALGQSPVGLRADAELLQMHDPQAWLKKNVLEQDTWIPVLAVGASQVVQSSFTLAGEIKVPGADPTAPASAATGMTDAFGAGSAEPQAAGRLTAEFLDYEILVPGRAPRNERRTLFDWIGASARAAGDAQTLAGLPPTPPEATMDLANETEILMIGAQPSTDLVAHLVGRSFLMIGSTTLQLLRRPTDFAQAVAETTSAPLPPSPLLLSLALARSKWSRFSDRVHIAEPNVFSVHSGSRFDPEGGLRFWAGLDIVANDVDVGQSGDADSALIRLEQGVLDTNVEGLLASGKEAQANVADLMSAARADARAWETLSTADRLGAAARWSPGPRSHLTRDIERGFVAVVSRADDTQAGVWWRVDPATGSTLGIGDRGWGQAMKEFIQANRVVIKIIAFILCFAYYGAMHRWGSAAVCVVGGGLSTAGVAGLGPVDGALFAYLADALGLIVIIYNIGSSIRGQ